MRWRRPDRKTKRWTVDLPTGAFAIEAEFDEFFGQTAYRILMNGRRFGVCWSLPSAKQTIAETDADIRRNTARGMGQ